MENFIYFWVFILGGLLGSFCNVVGYRLPKAIPFGMERSHCVHCNKTLTSLELIPIVSYLFLRGKCKNCKKPIPPLYTVNEFLTGALFLISYVFFKDNLPFAIFNMLLTLLLSAMFISDYNYKIIPNKLLLFFLIVLVPYALFFEVISIKGMLLGLATSFIMMVLLLVLTKGRAYGGGDVKLFLLLSLLFGTKFFVLGFFLSNMIGLVLALLYKAKFKTNEVPFGPSIMLGFIVTFMFGNEILSWYLGQF